MIVNNVFLLTVKLNKHISVIIFIMSLSKIEMCVAISMPVNHMRTDSCVAVIFFIFKRIENFFLLF